MNGNANPYPPSSTVDMGLYLADRQRLDDRLDRMENKISDRLDGMDSKIDALIEDRASNLGSQKERRRIATQATGLATFFSIVAGAIAKIAGVF